MTIISEIVWQTQIKTKRLKIGNFIVIFCMVVSCNKKAACFYGGLKSLYRHGRSVR